MSAFKHMFIKEVKQFFGLPIQPLIAAILPVVVTLLMPLISDLSIKDVRLCIVDHDRTTTSERLTNEIIESEYFIPAGYADTYGEAIDLLGHGECDIILEIPRGMERDYGRGETVELFIAANAVNSTKGTFGSGYLTSIISDFSTQLQEEAGATISAAGPISMQVQYRYNPHLSFRVYMVPALISVVLILLCGIIPALNIVNEKQHGTIEQINVSPLSKFDFILAKVILYGVAGMIAYFISLAIGHFVFNLRIYEPFPEILVSGILFLLFMSGFGLFFSNISDNMLQAVFTMFFFVLIFMLMSGVFTSISSMAPWAQWLTYAIPTRYYVELLRSVCLKGSTFADLRLDFIMLAVFALLFNVAAVITYRKQS